MTILLTAGLVLARVLGLIMSMPVTSSMSIPVLVKAMLVLLLTALLTPVVPPTDMSFGIGLLLVGMTSELMLGVLMGGIVFGVCQHVNYVCDCIYPDWPSRIDAV